jgi:hypothetical protein
MAEKKKGRASSDDARPLVLDAASYTPTQPCLSKEQKA